MYSNFSLNPPKVVRKGVGVTAWGMWLFIYITNNKIGYTTTHPNKEKAKSVFIHFWILVKRFDGNHTIHGDWTHTLVNLFRRCVLSLLWSQTISILNTFQTEFSNKWMRGELVNSNTICKSLSFRKRIKSKSESIYHIFGILSSNSSNERFYYKAGEKYYWNLSRVHLWCLWLSNFEYVEKKLFVENSKFIPKWSLKCCFSKYILLFRYVDRRLTSKRPIVSPRAEQIWLLKRWKRRETSSEQKGFTDRP